MGMLTFKITIYTGDHNTDPTNLSLLINLASIEGQDTGVGDGWYPKGSSSVQVMKFGRGKRRHILPA